MAFRFRKFRVYHDAIEFHKFIIRLTKDFPKSFNYLLSQIHRASLSVVLNIAEGSAKNSDRDFRRYIGNSLGSINEVIAGCEVALKENLISEKDFNQTESLAEKLTNNLGSLFQKLKS